jgi:plastocyanin
MRKKMSTLVVLGVAAVWTLSGCGGSGSSTAPSATEAGGASSQVTISGFAFSALTIPVGATVTWRNLDSTTHTATADASSAFRFDTGDIAAGATSATVTFTQAGAFAYFCKYHPGMRGTIVVQ